MKAFNFFLCFFMLLTVSITSCTEKEIPSPSSLPGTTAGSDVIEYREEEPIIIRGHVRNTSGSIISGATVNLFASGQGTLIRSTSTDTNGQYTMSGLDASNYDLKISATGYVSKSIGITLTAEMQRADTLISE